MSFHEKFKKSVIFMPHTLINYFFNIFSTFIKMAKNPKVIRKFKVENIIDPKEIKIGCIMHSALLNQLQLCTATSSVQNIFATPTLSFKIFCPSLSSRLETNESNQKRPSGDRHTDRGGDRNTDRGQNNDKNKDLNREVPLSIKQGKKYTFQEAWIRNTVQISWMQVRTVVMEISAILSMQFSQEVLQNMIGLW